MEANRHGQCRGWVGFSSAMAHRITAACDILLMPSRFEPCGLNQLYAMAYGTVPVVHAVSLIILACICKIVTGQLAKLQAFWPGAHTADVPCLILISST